MSQNAIKSASPSWGCVCAWCLAIMRSGEQPFREGCCNKCCKLYEQELKDMRLALQVVRGVEQRVYQRRK